MGPCCSSSHSRVATNAFRVVGCDVSSERDLCGLCDLPDFAGPFRRRRLEDERAEDERAEAGVAGLPAWRGFAGLCPGSL